MGLQQPNVTSAIKSKFLNVCFCLIYFSRAKKQVNSGRLHPANLNGFDNGTR